MPPKGRQTENLFLNLTGAAVAGLNCFGARVRERLSTISELRMEVMSDFSTFKPKDVLGTKITLEAENGFRFSGICISIEDMGHWGGVDNFALEVRPWLWLLTIGSENRIYQNKSTVDIVKDVFRDAGFTDLTVSVSKKLVVREYCVQFDESNFDFVSRLLEEEGITYFFDHSGSEVKVVLVDSVVGHPNEGSVSHTVSNQVGDKQGDSNSVFEWAEVERVVTGKVSLFDYNMERAGADLKVTATGKAGTHGHNAVERYQAKGHYAMAEDGEQRARQEAEGYAATALRARGVTNSPTILNGHLFTLVHPDRPDAEGTYLVVSATHYMQFNAGYSYEAEGGRGSLTEKIDYPTEMGLYEANFEVQRSSIQFRPPLVTKWPTTPSLLTATVTGPAGEEIYTDTYGRIKVQFPWDRLGKNDDKSSMWVRSVMPWAGEGWGMVSVPRIGMEVIIQFERGNIDRPYCTGVVYNSLNTAPYTLPGEMTKTGIRTNSTKGGGGFHELTFDDKKGAESVFFQSEKDYTQIVKNNAVITIGMEKKDKGSLTQTIYQDKTETIKMGDVKLTVETGSRVTDIKKDETTSIQGKSTHTIVGDVALEVKTGNLSEKISTGNMSTEVSMGNQSTKVSMGNVTIDASLGKVAITAMQEITLTVGANSVKIDMSGVTVTGTMVTVDGKAMTEVKAPVVKVAGSGITLISGGVVMVN